MGKLSVRKVETAKIGKHEDGNGLRLVVAKSGARSWVLRFTFNRKRREMGLGPFPIVSLADARQHAIDAKRLILKGLDPIHVRQVEQETKATPTFQSYAARYILTHRREWKSTRYAHQWVRMIRTYVQPQLGLIPVDKIETAHIMLALQPIWTTKTSTAKYVQARIESILDAASAEGYRNQFNPSRWKGHLDKLLSRPSRISKTKHHPAMPYKTIAGFITELRSQESVPARALEFLILTATRRNEAGRATWSEIDLENKTWTVPEKRMKGKKEHRIPLSDAAIKLLGLLPRFANNDFLFPGRTGGKSIGHSVLGQRMQEMGYGKNGQRGHYSVHGFRSTFRDWAGETTNFPNHVVEMALAHQISNKTEAAYRRGDLFEKRRILMESWASYCSTSAQVVPFSRRPAITK